MLESRRWESEDPVAETAVAAAEAPGAEEEVMKEEEEEEERPRGEGSIEVIMNPRRTKKPAMTTTQVSSDKISLSPCSLTNARTSEINERSLPVESTEMIWRLNRERKR